MNHGFVVILTPPHKELKDTLEGQMSLLARQFEAILGLEPNTLQGVATVPEDAKSELLEIKLPRHASRHPNLLAAWYSLIGFSKNAKDQFRVNLRPNLVFVSVGE